MLGTTQVSKPKKAGEYTVLTPEMASGLLEHNSMNRPISDQHVQRIARQIIDGKWKFNGDTIKVANNGNVLDGQHRCWAIIEAKRAVETIVVRGIEPDAFATIDTLRKVRSGGDLIALKGQERHRSIVAAGLTWLLRYQRKVIEKHREPTNKIENNDIEAAFDVHGKQFVRAVERAMAIRRVASPALMSFLYYVATNQNAELAEQMLAALDNPGRLSQSHPFFHLRQYFLNNKKERRDPVVSIALTIKALNAAFRGESIKALNWKSQGQRVEEFPTLLIAGKAR